MKKFALTLVYILVTVISVNYFKAEGNTNSSLNSTSSTENGIHGNHTLKSRISLPMLLSSGPAKPVPEPINFSLFGFGFFIVVGFGWIKKNPDKH
jgi:hypothetical protein